MCMRLILYYIAAIGRVVLLLYFIREEEGEDNIEGGA